jgi:thymidylate synthase
MHFTLTDGELPMISVKKTFDKQVRGELDSFISGDVHVQDFHKNNCTLWDEWVKVDNDYLKMPLFDRPVVVVPTHPKSDLEYIQEYVDTNLSKLAADTVTIKFAHACGVNHNSKPSEFGDLLESAGSDVDALVDIMSLNGSDTSHRITMGLVYAWLVYNDLELPEQLEDFILFMVIGPDSNYFSTIEELLVDIRQEHGIHLRGDVLDQFELTGMYYNVRRICGDTAHYFHKSEINEWSSLNEKVSKKGQYRRALNNGYLGPIYGAQWRNFGNQGVDQLKMALDELDNNPMSSRMIVSAWNPVG